MDFKRRDRLFRAIGPLALVAALMLSVILLLGLAVRRSFSIKNVFVHAPKKRSDIGGLIDRAGGIPMVMGTAALMAALFVVALPWLALPVSLSLLGVLLATFFFGALRSPEPGQ